MIPNPRYGAIIEMYTLEIDVLHETWSFVVVTVLFLLAELQTICQSYHQRIANLEGDKYDLEQIEKHKAFEVQLYTIHRPCDFFL